jgi:hypothetical protein
MVDVVVAVAAVTGYTSDVAGRERSWREGQILWREEKGDGKIWREEERYGGK